MPLLVLLPLFLLPAGPRTGWMGPAAHATAAPGSGGWTDGPERYWSFEFRGEPLKQVLETVARVTETDMLYDPDMLEDVVIFQRIHEQPMPRLLSVLLADTPFDYIVLSSGSVVIVRKVADEPAFGSFAGKVRDGRTGKPLHGATVLLADAAGGTATNSSGTFQLNRMISGSHRIVISYVGYHPVETVVEIRPDEMVRTEVSLEPRPLSFNPVVIEAHRPELAGIDNHASVQSLANWDVSGGRRDPIRSLGLFAGLQYGLPLQDIHLQGGRQGEHRIRLDGIPVYNPYHFGHLYSSFSPLAISDVRLHKAGFGAAEGSMLSGIIDFVHDIPSPGSRGITLLGDPVNANLRADISITGDGGDSSGTGDTPAQPYPSVSATGNLRSNFWDLYQEPNLQQTLKDWGYVDQILAENLLQAPGTIQNEYESLKQVSDLRYLDGHAAIQYEPNPYHTINASVWHGRNRIRMTALNRRHEGEIHDRYLFTRDDYQWHNMIGQVRWDASPGPRLTISTRAGFSSGRMDHRYHMFTRHTADMGLDEIGTYLTASGAYSRMSDAVPVEPRHAGSNRIDHGLFRSALQYHFTPQFRVENGLELNAVSSQVDFSDFFFLPTSLDENTLFGTLFSNLHYHPGQNWQITAGSRFTHLDTHSRTFAEPRLSVQYNRVNSAIGYWSARLAAGVYRQFIHQYDITNVGPTSLVPSFTVWSHASADEPPKAYHMSGSWLHQLSALTTLKLEAYYKWEPTHYVSSPLSMATEAGFGFDRSSAEAFSESTRLRSGGFSVRLQQLLPDPQIKLMMGYDYTRAKLHMSQFGRTVPAPWNEPHRIQARGIIDLYGPISVIANWKSVYGRAWGFRQAYYDYLWVTGTRTIGGQFDFGTPEDDRLPAFHQLDLSLRYRPSLGSLRVDVHLDLINVLNRRNVIDWSLKPAGTTSTQPPQPSSHNTANGGVGGAGGYVGGGDSGDGSGVSQDYDITYEIHERTMPGFYPVLRLEIGL
ncbi:MAG: carboxypeptidase-like regulatory domain-containing protein [Bacteroidota bacterium]